MANPTCSATTWITNAACFTQLTLDPARQKALLAYAMALELAAIGGTDYTTSISNNLVTDAVQTVCAITPDQIMAARINLAYVNAAAAGASVPATMDLKLFEIRRLMNITPDEMEKVLLLLTCKLGVHKTYPQ